MVPLLIFGCPLPRGRNAFELIACYILFAFVVNLNPVSNTICTYLIAGMGKKIIQLSV